MIDSHRLSNRRAFLAASAAALGGAVLPARVRAQAQLTNVRVGELLFDPFAEPLFGKESGAFARAGFDLELTNFNNGGAPLSALSGGALDLAISDLVLGLNAINSGLPIVLLAGSALYQSTDNNLIIAVPKSSPIKQVRDLSGKVLAVPTLVGQVSLAVKAWVAKNGLSPETLKIVEVPQTGVFAAMQRGTVDAALFGEPILTAVRGELRDIGHPLDEIASDYLVSAWYASRAWVEADRPRAKRFVAAIYEAARWSNTHRSETLAAMVREGKYDPSRLQDITRSTFATSMTSRLVQPVLDAAARYKVVDKQYAADSLMVRL